MVSRYQFDHQLRKKYGNKLLGLDEVGVGAIAGPIVAAGVILKPQNNLPDFRDSKHYSNRSFNHFENLARSVLDCSLFAAIGVSNNRIIDDVGTITADRLAMIQVLKQLNFSPNLVLIDGDRSHCLNQKYVEKNVKKGDAKSQTIAAASILATYMSYRILKRFDKQYPKYHFMENKGYYNTGHQSHLTAIKKYGITPIHRITFSPIKNHYYDYSHVFETPTRRLRFNVSKGN